MKKRALLQRIILVLIALICLGSLIACAVMKYDRPWLAFYVACCGGVMAVNLIIVLIFVRKNVK